MYPSASHPDKYNATVTVIASVHIYELRENCFYHSSGPSKLLAILEGQVPMAVEKETKAVCK